MAIGIGSTWDEDWSDEPTKWCVTWMEYEEWSYSSGTWREMFRIFDKRDDAYILVKHLRKNEAGNYMGVNLWSQL